MDVGSMVKSMVACFAMLAQLLNGGPVAQWRPSRERQVNLKMTGLE